MKRVNWKSVFIIFFIILLAAVAVGSFVWMQNTLGPASTAVAALQSDDAVMVTLEEDFIIFEPTGGSATTGFIFYPGGGVDYRSYAPVLRHIAAQNYFVVGLAAPLNLAFFDTNAADEIMAKYPRIEKWAVGGHSLGGVAATINVGNNDAIDGLVLWAAYPANDVLKEAGIPVVSIFGSLDGLSTIEDINASKTLLPANSQFVEISGGNHAQFGAYGAQSGDRRAAISPEEQWMQIAAATAAFLDELSP